MVYRMFHKNQEMYSYETERLDGDLKKAYLLDTTEDGGRRIEPFDRYAGRPIDPTYLPTKVKFGGPKREITDVYMAGAYLVSEKFKVVVDKLEPETHQFFPVELFWSDGSSAGQRYWFFPCNRLDTVDEEKTTKNRRGKLWDPGDDFENDGQFVFNRSQINGHHIWIDKFMVGIIGILMSNQMHDALLAAGVTGMGFNAFEETG